MYEHYRVAVELPHERQHFGRTYRLIVGVGSTTEASYRFIVEIELLDLSVGRHRSLFATDGVGAFADTVFCCHRQHDTIVGVTQIDILMTLVTLHITHRRDAGRIASIDKMLGIDGLVQHLVVLGVGEREHLQTGVGALLLAEHIHRGLGGSAFRRHCHFDDVAFLADSEQLMHTRRFDGYIRQCLGAVRHLHIHGVAFARSLGVSAPVNRIVGRSHGRTFQYHVIDGAVRLVGVGVLAVIHHLGGQLTVDPLAVVQPFDLLCLVVYFACELQCRHADIVIADGLGESIAVLCSRSTIYGSGRQFGVIDKMYLVVHHTRLIDRVSSKLFGVLLVARREHDIKLGHRTYTGITDRHTHILPTVQGREITGIVTLCIVATVGHRQP